jgi:hypothetical protein
MDSADVRAKRRSIWLYVASDLFDLPLIKTTSDFVLARLKIAFSDIRMENTYKIALAWLYVTR